MTNWTPETSYAEAIRLITQENQAQSGSLDLSELVLAEIPIDITLLVHLRRLVLSCDPSERTLSFNDLSPLSGLTNLEEISCDSTQVSDLKPLSALTNLKKLSFHDTNVSDLSPVSGLTKLKKISCDHTQVSDLKPLSALANLKKLSFNYTKVSDLSPLSGLTNLEEIDCDGTQVSDPKPLSALANLKKLIFNFTKVSDLSPLSGLTGLETLHFSRTKVSDLSPLSALTGLETLHFSRTKVSDLNPLSGLNNLREVYCSHTLVSDLSPLSGLNNLEGFHCDGSPVSDLSPLSGLNNLREINFGFTLVSDLSPLSGLNNLKDICCDRTPVSDLSPVAKLTNLEFFGCSSAQVGDINPLSGLINLYSLNFDGTAVSDLSPVSGLTSLKSIYLGDTQINDLTPLSGLNRLELIDCDDTQVSDLSPLSALTRLETLYFNRTNVSDLKPLSELTSLNNIMFGHTKVSDLSPLSGLSNLFSVYCPGLESLVCFDANSWPTNLREIFTGTTKLLNLPMELYQDGILNFREFQAHYQDLGAGEEKQPRLKLIILGNGEVGKTQLRRRLCGESFTPTWDSTHGIETHCANLSHDDYPNDLVLNIWDFGGQEIYHGTHALFMRSQAIFVICWHPDFETGQELTETGNEIARRPLSYWLDFLKHTAGPDVPLLLVRTRGNDRRAGEMLPDGVYERLQSFQNASEVYIDTADKNCIDTINQKIRRAIDTLQQQFGSVYIGSSRANLALAIETMKEADSLKLPEERKFQTITQEHFDAICCNTTPKVSSTEHALSFLNNAGVVFYRKGLFGDRIILDQNWALAAIYSVFDRENSFHILRKLNGKFSRQTLEFLIWNEMNYSKAEQRLFLSMMEQCAIAFRVSPHSGEGSQTEAEYIAPAVLPDRHMIESRISEAWIDDAESASQIRQYKFLHGGFSNQLIVEVGRIAFQNAIYWSSGLQVYDANTKSIMRLEIDIEQNIVAITAQNGNRTELIKKANELCARVDRVFGFQPEVSAENLDSLIETTPDEKSTLAPIDPQPAPTNTGRYVVSYAWNDVEDTDREKPVDSFCQYAESKGVKIIRDKTDMRLGNSIRDFMDELTEADRVYVFLSDKYLRSVFCMYELYGVWAKQGQIAFRNNVKVFIHPCANVGDVVSRASYARYWKDEIERYEDAVGGDMSLFGIDGRHEHSLMMEFRNNVADILSTIMDQLQPRGIEQFNAYSLEND